MEIPGWGGGVRGDIMENRDFRESLFAKLQDFL
jgi:hypothetical protein